VGRYRTSCNGYGDMTDVDARAIRVSLNLTQDQFAKRFQLNLATVRQWEQQRRQPTMHAKVLLAVIAFAPEVVDQVLRGGG
jgi:putative transcriptional regulator